MSGNIKPPTCKSSSCRRCTGFSYCPTRPEEVGQWWLPRRKDFDVRGWIERVKQHPTEYCCIGCEQKVSDHETMFEYEVDRKQRGAPVGQLYFPLNDSSSFLKYQVKQAVDEIGNRKIGTRAASATQQNLIKKS